VGMELRRRGLRPRTIRQYMRYLVRLAAEGCDLDDVSSTERAIDWLGDLYSPGGLPLIFRDDILKAAISVPRLRLWRVYLRLLYETGARPREAL